MSHEMPEQPRYWFPAKRYGWGWGPPTTWQGWFVVAGYVVLAAAGSVVIEPSVRPGLFIVHLLLLTAVMIAVCRAKGEPPRWRWGKRDSR
jgi:hypothetical protein